jgi:hypothetical protein
MVTSPLDIGSSESFRKKCITKNLKPYGKSPRKITPPLNYVYVQSELAVKDSPDALIDNPTLANKLYPLNRYGAEGGYKQVPDPTALLNKHSNEGEYGPFQQDARILEQALPESKKWKKVNPYSDGTQTVKDAGEGIIALETPKFGTGIFNNQPYYKFVPSFYNPASILLTRDPSGSDGFLSQDSFIAKLGAQRLRESFQSNIARNIRRNTLGRDNAANSNNANNSSNTLTGTIPILAPDYRITIPNNPVPPAEDLLLRLAGSTRPTSPIPGSYFNPQINPGQPTTIQQLTNAFRPANLGILNFFNTVLGGSKTGSEIFLENTGGGQKSRLFDNINFNRYKPYYERGSFNRLEGAVVGTLVSASNFYIGSITSDPSRILSPGGDVPVNFLGQEVQAPVYGPTEIAQLFEGPSREVRLGANGVAYSNGGGIEGGMTWVSPKFRNNAGKKVGIGGEVTEEDEDFKPSSYNNTESTSLVFRNNSILDNTQRIINSQPRGGRRLQHVGNAIDQVSKVFNDGYTEMTKGSRVLKYVGAIGQEVGTEYARVFAKDIPYLQYNDLQKVDGTTTEGRRFAYSVLDKTYNLNIAPNKLEGGQDSSNLVADSANNVGYAKKYMFSIENLAWRTSNTPGFNVSELPLCERGPNGGRIMWFPPYDLKFNENISANWKPNDFLGRPEPVYTYTNTTRTGSLSWKIVVDHPSVLNVIVNKVMSNETNRTRINSMLSAFFAGALKYDLYELAKKYYTISPNELADLQQAISSKELSREQLNFAKNQVASGNDNSSNVNTEVAQATPNTPTQNFEEFQNYALFFPSNSPTTTQEGKPYNDIYDEYNKVNFTNEESKAFFNVGVTANYDKIKDTFIPNLKSFLDNNPNSVVTINLEGSAVNPETDGLSKRRIDSVVKYFSQSLELKKFIDTSRITFGTPILKVGNTDVQIKNTTTDPSSKDFKPHTYGDCTTVADGSPENNSAQSMACRRVKLKTIVTTTNVPTQPNSQPSQQTNGNRQGTVPINTVPPQELETKINSRDNITKRIVRALISECDYFETIKAETPMVYDNLKEKLKFFQPAFHSTTPEGLNSRLTFLQQCTRPGDTIPTVKQTEGGSPELVYSDATNTSFGVPPVLILRVGDFYNTKIIPTSLSLTYEGLDLNPEGIGVQPMICNVTLNFNFIGGSGLKEAVDKIQNALSFNFYANTEMWDDRADVTDDSLKVLDNEFLKLVNQPKPPTNNQVGDYNSQSNQNTIGTILSKNVTTTEEVGTISYQTFMDRFVENSQTYFQNVINKSKDCLKQYNNAMLQQWTTQRIYGDGIFNPVPNNDKVKIFGKPDKMQDNIDKIFKELQSNIDSDKDLFIIWMKSPRCNFSEKVIRQLKKNYISYVKSKKSPFLNSITKIIQESVISQQNYLAYLGRGNTLYYGLGGSTSLGTDGLQEPNGNLKIYDFSGTTGVGPGTPSSITNTQAELVEDMKKIGDSLVSFNLLLEQEYNFNFQGINYNGKFLYDTNKVNDKTIFVPFNQDLNRSGDINFSLQQSINLRIQYFLLSDDLVDSKYETFKNSILSNIIGNKTLIGNGSGRVSEEFDNYWKINVKPVFEKETQIANEFVDSFEKNKLKDYIKFTPFPSKTRVMDYRVSTTPDNTQKQYIKGLGISTNINNDKKTWNDSKDGAYVSKVKLN